MLAEKLPSILKLICSFLILPYISTYNLIPSIIIWDLSIKNDLKNIGSEKKAK
jgi:hypothetical protein